MALAEAAAAAGIFAGETLGHSGAVSELGSLAEKAGTGGVKLVTNTVSSATHATFSIAEKLFIATIIFICIILLIVGASLLVNSNWKSGGIITTLGAAGVAGSIYWLKHPASAGILGRWEGGDDYGDGDDPLVVSVSDVDDESGDKDEADFEELEGEVDYLDVEQPKESEEPGKSEESREHKKKKKEKKKHNLPKKGGLRRVHFNLSKNTFYDGANESNLFTDLKNVIDILKNKDKGADSSATLSDIKDSIEQSGEDTENTMKTIVESIDKSLANKEEIIASFQGLEKSDQDELLSLLEETQKLISEVGEQGREIELKLEELVHSLRT
jgi:hypothetical protein